MARLTCCGIQFQGEDGYVQHRQRIHGEQPSARGACCAITFFTEEGYSEHRRAHHGDTGETPAMPSPVVEPSRPVRSGMEGVAPVVAYLEHCKVCRTPIRGWKAFPSRLKGITPFAKNPQLCNR